jgi:hypothetical protein
VERESVSIDFDNKMTQDHSPPNQQALNQGVIDFLAPGSNVTNAINAAQPLSVKGSYSLYFEYCQPKSGSPAGVFHAIHGLAATGGYWNVKIE